MLMWGRGEKEKEPDWRLQIGSSEAYKQISSGGLQSVFMKKKQIEAYLRSKKNVTINLQLWFILWTLEKEIDFNTFFWKVLFHIFSMWVLF